MRGNGGRVHSSIPTHLPPTIKYSYVKVCRKNQSFFIMCEPTQTALHIKKEVASCLDESVSPEALQLQTTEKNILQDTDSLQDLKNGEEVYVCLPIADGEWEPVDVVSLESSMAE